MTDPRRKASVPPLHQQDWTEKTPSYITVYYARNAFAVEKETFFGQHDVDLARRLIKIRPVDSGLDPFSINLDHVVKWGTGAAVAPKMEGER